MKSFRRSAFTLAEMLVVIAIILILAALLIPAAFYALSIAKTAAIVTELGQLSSAMQEYKVLNRSFPPNSNTAATAIEPVLKAHIQSIYGRSNPEPPFAMTPAESLVFWLQGYSDIPNDPLGGTRKALMQFDQTRLRPTRSVTAGSKTWQLYTYSPPDGQQVPYVYFHNSYYATPFTPSTTTPVTPGQGVARAYKSSTAPNPFINLDSFQIISAGLDGDYGLDNANKQFPNGLNYQTGDKDNVTNFSGGALGSKVP